MKWLNSITKSMEINLNKLQEIMEESWTAADWHATVHGVAESDIP